MKNLIDFTRQKTGKNLLNNKWDIFGKREKGECHFILNLGLIKWGNYGAGVSKNWQQRYEAE